MYILYDITSGEVDRGIQERARVTGTHVATGNYREPNRGGQPQFLYQLSHHYKHYSMKNLTYILIVLAIILGLYMVFDQQSKVDTLLTRENII